MAGDLERAGLDNQTFGDPSKGVGPLAELT